nr:SAM-dependent methyltransferase [Bacteriovorax sp. HI3]
MKTTGTLTLIPTPLSEEGELEPRAFRLLNEAATNERENSVFVIEDLKPGRRRWLGFKLPRDCVESFVLYNEHTAQTVSKELLAELQKGKNVFLMSDGGLPAFYDPGVELVNLCHQNKIRVTSTPFFNSVSLALALSGFSHRKFWFEGFLPIDSEERAKAIKNILNLKTTAIVMDTPYRLKRVLEEFQSAWGSSKKKLFVAMDLNAETEELQRGTPKELLNVINDVKREFVLIVSE